MEQLLVANSIAVWLVLLGNVLLTLALVRKVNGINQANSHGGRPMLPREFLKVGQAAPNFAAETLSGKLVTLADYAGRKVAFLFMSPGCRPCREEIPTLEALQPKAALSGVTLVLVITADPKNARTFVQDLGVSLPVLITEPEGKFKADYKVGGTPFYCLVSVAALFASLAQSWADCSHTTVTNPIF